ncbi:thiol reductant ABC exporter subunit CydD [Liquorilactobacillus mali]|uniref:Transport ATP-binding protein CydC n=1 Tax=Liquorilactobacillus mali TaxID=1618 RepID=A0A0R2FWL0_9LACO|nr:thiol reductant ABC exporter subunit CydD [Liquorilactobacillus mali]KRN32043.1 transport ATP-binding protein CydC [Liquorilactobacillus mali]MDN7145454.1 thiol reductant ABC exporter subunit CydD [Liquorilactobacillus mali]
MIDKKLMLLPGIKKILLILTGLALMQAVAIVGQACFLSTAIVNLWSGNGLVSQFKWILLFFLCYALRHLVNFYREELLDKYAAEQAGNIRGKLLEKIFYLGPIVIQSNGTGNTTTMALEGIDQVEDYLHLIFAKVTTLMIVPWIVLAAIFYFDWESAAFLLGIFPVIIIFMIVLGYAAQSRADRQYVSYQMLSNHFVDSLRGIDTLKYFGLSKRYANSIFKTSEKFRKATLNTLKIAILSTFALDFFTTLSIAVVAVFLGLRLIDGHMVLYPALTILILSPEYFLPIRDFSSDYHATLNGKNALGAINKILDVPEPKILPLSINEWNNSSRLEFSNLSFSYAENKPALKKIKLAVSGYKKVGIIGLSGSGKSTLINILSGFLNPDEAVIRFNDKEAASFAQKDWQKQLIYIPQSPYIFKGTLRDNVVFYQPDATMEQVKQAVEVVGLSELVSELPMGLDTQIGEGARALSGGQAQRIALARAFLDKQRKVLLFDEPTAHLDIETEVELKERMLPLMENHLVFFATHRLHWMKEMDLILVMDKGQVVEAGTLDELRQSNGAFAELMRSLRRR